MRRRDLISVMGVITVVAPSIVRAQQTAKLQRIGYLAASGQSVNPAFADGMRELGYIEGQNIAIVFRSADQKLDRLPQLAAELASVPVDLIVTVTTPAAAAAKAATATIPIVMATA